MQHMGNNGGWHNGLVEILIYFKVDIYAFTDR